MSIAKKKKGYNYNYNPSDYFGIKKINLNLDNMPMLMNLSEYIKCKDIMNFIFGFSLG